MSNRAMECTTRQPVYNLRSCWFLMHLNMHKLLSEVSIGNSSVSKLTKDIKSP